MVWPLEGYVQTPPIRPCPLLPFSPYPHVAGSRTVYLLGSRAPGDDNEWVNELNGANGLEGKNPKMALTMQAFRL